MRFHPDAKGGPDQDTGKAEEMVGIGTWFREEAIKLGIEGLQPGPQATRIRKVMKELFETKYAGLLADYEASELDPDDESLNPYWSPTIFKKWMAKKFEAFRIATMKADPSTKTMAQSRNMKPEFLAGKVM